MERMLPRLNPSKYLGFNRQQALQRLHMLTKIALRTGELELLFEHFNELQQYLKLER